MLWLTYHLGFYINVFASEKKFSRREPEIKVKPLFIELLIIFLTLRVVNYLNIVH